MAFNEKLENRTYTAASAITQFRFVTLNSSAKVAHTGAGARADGVALAAAAGDGAVLPVAYDGRVTVVAAGTITAGAAVASNASGQAVAATTGNVILGRALEAGASGQVITIEIDRAGSIA